MAPEKDKDKIIEDPSQDDVLLGQGHYRHPGNQNLNSIVDSKVQEYQVQSRPFKTYMAHDIIQRLRNKGVRFLKELAPKGWIVVEDDKEAREKVAQRFQYTMRMQAKNSAAAGSTTTSTTKAKSKKAAPTTEFVPAPQPNLVWNGTTVKVPFLPVFHQLQRSSVMVDDDINAVSRRLLECLGIIDVEESFNHEQASTVLTGPENLKARMNFWKPLGSNRGVIVELVNLVGEIITFQKYSRYILEAATGLFDRYKHTLLQSRRLTASSVQDQVTSYAANCTKKIPARGPSTDENINKDKINLSKVASSGMVKLATGRVNQETIKKNGPATVQVGAPFDASKALIKRPSVRRLEQKTSLAVDSSMTAGVLNNKVEAKPPVKLPPSVKLLELAPRPPAIYNYNYVNLKHPEPNVKKESTTGIFADAFSHWETGTEVACEAAEKAPLAGTFASAFGRWETGIETQDKAIATYSSKRWVATAPKESRVNPVCNTSEQFAASSVNVTGAEDLRLLVASEKKDTGKNSPPTFSPSNSTEAMRRLSLSAATGGKNSDSDGESIYKPYPIDRWSTAVPNQEMKCDSSIEYNVNSELAAADQATETLKRMSISSNDASYVGPRVRGDDVFEAFSAGGAWPQAFSNQEMKCDSSFDDDPFAVGSVSSKQSFIPSSLFESAAPGARSRSRLPNAPSPANSLCSHISVEMRSIPSPSTSFHSQISVEVFSLPSPAGSFNSRCSLGMNSVKNVRMDESISPSMFRPDRLNEDEKEEALTDTLYQDQEGDTEDAILPKEDSVPPAIFVDSCSALVGPSA